MPFVIVASTIPPYKCGAGQETAWLANAEAIVEDCPDALFFIALEVRPRCRMGVFDDLLKRIVELPHQVWTFGLDDGEEFLTSQNRLSRICLGRNVITEFAMRTTADHLLYADSDVELPGDCISKLLEVRRPIVGGDVPSYCLSGPDVGGYAFPVQQHWNTAGFLLVERAVFSRVRWRHDPDKFITDDPCYAADVEAAGFGPTLVRKDVVGHHVSLEPLEARGHDLSL